MCVYIYIYMHIYIRRFYDLSVYMYRIYRGYLDLVLGYGTLFGLGSAELRIRVPPTS